MPQTINTNIASLNAQRSLNSSQSDANTALQRLSSGLRINSAKDDAAGLAISNRLTSQINGLNQAIRNSNDAISVSQVAEGALAESGNILQRMREIAVQSANASNSGSDRLALQSEVAQLTAELDRIADNTAFGDNKLLNGSFSQKSFQVGANVGETVTVSIASAKAADLGNLYEVDFTNSNFFTGAVKAAATQANNESYIEEQTLTFSAGPSNDLVDYSVNIADNATAATIASTITAEVAGLSATAKTVAVISIGTTAFSNAGSTGVFNVNGVSLTGVDTASLAGFTASLESKIESSSSLSNLTVNSTSTTLEIIDESGADITFGIESKTGAANFELDIDVYDDTVADGGSAVTTTSGQLADLDSAAAGAAAFTTISGEVKLFTTDNTKTYKIEGSLDQSAASGGVAEATQATATTTSQNLQVDDVSVSTVAKANQAIQIIDAALTEISSQRADLGAVQNRFDSVIANLSNVSENSSAARSRIQDADFAQETANLARAQILQQAGISVLAQANAQPQNVLALLQ
jgi:flagellin